MIEAERAVESGHSSLPYRWVSDMFRMVTTSNDYENDAQPERSTFDESQDKGKAGWHYADQVCGGGTERKISTAISAQVKIQIQTCCYRRIQTAERGYLQPGRPLRHYR